LNFKDFFGWKSQIFNLELIFSSRGYNLWIIFYNYRLRITHCIIHLHNFGNMNYPLIFKDKIFEQIFANGFSLFQYKKLLSCYKIEEKYHFIRDEFSHNWMNMCVFIPIVNVLSILVDVNYFKIPLEISFLRC